MITVAMLYPGHSAEDEYATLERRFVDVSFPIVHTWEGATDHDVQSLLALGARDVLSPHANAARRLGPDAVMWACTSGSFVFDERVEEQAGWVSEASGAPASSTTLAFVAAARHLGVRQVRLAATYPADVSAHFVAVLNRSDVTVVDAASHDVASGEDAGRLDPRQVRAMICAGHEDGVDAVLVPDTALHTVDLIESLEAELDTIVLTANAVTAWQGLRLAGHSALTDGLGRLFRMP